MSTTEWQMQLFANYITFDYTVQFLINRLSRSLIYIYKTKCARMRKMERRFLGPLKKNNVSFLVRRVIRRDE